MWSRGASKNFHSPLAPMSLPCGPEEGKTGWEHTSLNDTFTRHLVHSSGLGAHLWPFSTHLIMHLHSLRGCVDSHIVATTSCQHPLCYGGFTVQTPWDRSVDLSLPSFYILFLCQRAVPEEAERAFHLFLVASWYTLCNGISRPFTLSLLRLLSLPPPPSTITNFTKALPPTWQKELKWADLLYKSLSVTHYSFLYV